VHSVSLGSSPASKAVKKTVKRPAPRELRRDAMRAVRHRLVYVAPPPPDKSFMMELRRRFLPEVVALSEYLERDLVALWGYDELG
jgi:hypothetical protein